MFTITNCKLIKENEIIENCNIVIEDGKIKDVNTVKDVTGNYDAKNNFVSAGLIDIHTHGGYGYDFMDCDKKAFDNVLKFHLDNGTTSVLATTVTSSLNSIKKFFKSYREYISNKMNYAEPIGIHLEGPYLSIRNKGAQKEEYILRPDKDDYGFILDNFDIVKTVTISPELPKADEMTKRLVEKGIIVCGGHDDGIFPEFIPAIESGLSHLTHVYCAMSEVRFKDGKRNVGLREYGLCDDRLSAEMIFDNRHIIPELAKMIIKLKGIDKVCVVSDSLRCAGMPNDGRLYKLGSINDSDAQLFKVADGVAVLADGTRYAGSITPIRKMVLNLIDCGYSICDAFKTATINPAKIIKRDDLGKIEKNCIADLCIYDENFNIKNVMKKGLLVKKEV